MIVSVDHYKRRSWGPWRILIHSERWIKKQEFIQFIQNLQRQNASPCSSCSHVALETSLQRPALPSCVSPFFGFHDHPLPHFLCTPGLLRRRSNIQIGCSYAWPPVDGDSNIPKMIPWVGNKPSKTAHPPTKWKGDLKGLGKLECCKLPHHQKS